MISSKTASLFTAAITFLAVGSNISAFSPLIPTHASMRQSVHNNAARHIPLRPPPLMMSKNFAFESPLSEFEAQTTTMVEKEEKKDAMNPDDNITTTAASKEDNTNKTDNAKMTNMQLMAAAAAFALAFTPISDADAAMSGGRIGGSFSTPRQTESKPAPKRSSSSYSKGYSRGYSSGYATRPSVTIAPVVPVPSIGYGYGGGYATPYYSPFGLLFAPRVYVGPSAVAVFKGLLLALSSFCSLG